MSDQFMIMSVAEVRKFSPNAFPNHKEEDQVYVSIPMLQLWQLQKTQELIDTINHSNFIPELRQTFSDFIINLMGVLEKRR